MFLTIPTIPWWDIEVISIWGLEREAKNIHLRTYKHITLRVTYNLASGYQTILSQQSKMHIHKLNPHWTPITI